MNSRMLGGLIATMVLLQGCASTMSEDECTYVDWRTVGYEDGSRGEPAHRLGQHRKACAEHAVAPDLEAYQAGRSEGLREYCQPANGFQVGVNGRAYAGACPVELEEDFLAAYKSGHKLYDLESRLADLNNQIAYHDRAIVQAETNKDTLEMVVISDDASIQERAQALFNAKDLGEQKDRLEDERKVLMKDRKQVQRRLDKYRNSLAYNF